MKYQYSKSLIVSLLSFVLLSLSSLSPQQKPNNRVGFPFSVNEHIRQLSSGEQTHPFGRDVTNERQDKRFEPRLPFSHSVQYADGRHFELDRDPLTNPSPVNAQMANSDWVNWWKGAYTYDVNGNMTEELDQWWDNDISAWVNDTRDTYTYDSNGNMTEMLEQRWDNAWLNQHKHTYTYDADGNLTEELDQWWYEPEGRIRTADFMSSGMGWIAGEHILLKTEDGGQTWDSLSQGTNRNIQLIDFIDDSIGWAIEQDWINGMILKTQDGGQSWLIQETFADNYSIRSLYVVSDGVAYTAGIIGQTPYPCGKVMKTMDGGLSWADVTPSNDRRDLNSVCFFSSEMGVVGGECSSDGGIIWRTFDGGNTWDEATVPDFIRINDLQFVNDSTLYFLADGQYLYESKDTLNSWTQKTDAVASYYALENNVVYAIKEGSIMKSADGGLSWTEQYSGHYDLILVKFVDYSTGWVVGNRGTVLATTDGGNSWIDRSVFLAPYASWVNNDKHTYTYDADGNLTEELEQDWENNGWVNDWKHTYTYDSNGNMTEELEQWWENNAWVNDWKHTYTHDSSGNMTEELWQYWENNAWVNRHKHTYTYDSNGNRTEWLEQGWDEENDAWVSNNLWTYTYDDYGHLIEEIVPKERGGWWWSIVPTRITYTYDANWHLIEEIWQYNYDYTGLWIENDDIIPQKIIVYQNYPNPFNPITTVQYELPQRTDVTLTIYDILGRRVRTLVQGVEEPGSKSVVWDGTDDLGYHVSAGVYFYQIRAGDFTQTRKMLLLK